MNEAKPQRSKIVRDYLTSHPDAQSLTLAKGLYKKYPQWFASVEAARNSVRYYRGNHGDQSRKDMARKDMMRPNGKAGELPPCPPNNVEDWSPFVLDAKRVLVLSDIHVPYHDTVGLTAAVKYGKDFGPDAVLLNGDTIDFFSISRWDKDPSKRDLPGEIKTTKALIAWIKSVFPKARIVFKEGNHEERWTKYIWAKAPELWDLPQCRLEHILELSDSGVDHVTDQRPIHAGQLPILHGHELGRSVFSPVNQARGTFLRTNHSCLVGHGHRTSTHCEPDMNHNETTTWSTGCLCDRRPDFSRYNKWNLGFACVEVYADGNFNVHNLRISEHGKVRAA